MSKDEIDLKTQLLDFMESEIQQDLTLAKYLLQAIDKKHKSFEFTGNSHQLIINKDHFEIQNLYVDCEIVKGKTIALKHSILSWIYADQNP